MSKIALRGCAVGLALAACGQVESNRGAPGVVPGAPVPTGPVVAYFEATVNPARSSVDFTCLRRAVVRGTPSESFPL